MADAGPAEPDCSRVCVRARARQDDGCTVSLNPCHSLIWVKLVSLITVKAVTTVTRGQQKD